MLANLFKKPTGWITTPADFYGDIFIYGGQSATLNFNFFNLKKKNLRFFRVPRLAEIGYDQNKISLYEYWLPIRTTQRQYRVPKKLLGENEWAIMTVYIFGEQADAAEARSCCRYQNSCNWHERLSGHWQNSGFINNLASEVGVTRLWDSIE